MRITPVIFALALLGTGIARSAEPAPLDSRAAALEEKGRAALASGAVDAATDDFEAALALDPGKSLLELDLAEAARRDGMQGKALHYYRAVLADDPQNLMALSGEGSALAEKGALDKARRNLARLQSLCGDQCEATRQLAATLARVAPPPALTAEATQPTTEVSAN